MIKKTIYYPLVCLPVHVINAGQIKLRKKNKILIFSQLLLLAFLETLFSILMTIQKPRTVFAVRYLLTDYCYHNHKIWSGRTASCMTPHFTVQNFFTQLLNPNLNTISDGTLQLRSMKLVFSFTFFKHFHHNNIAIVYA